MKFKDNVIGFPQPSVFEKPCYEFSWLEDKQVDVLFRWFTDIANNALRDSDIDTRVGRFDEIRIERVDDRYSCGKVSFEIIRPGRWHVFMKGEVALEYQMVDNAAGLLAWLTQQVREGSAKWDKPR